MNPQRQDDWDIILRFLPPRWEDKALELGALLRRRKIDSANTLLRILMIHLAGGMSLRTTAAYAHEAKLCDINDAALLHRLKASEHWLHWMCVEVLKEMNLLPRLPDPLRGFQVRVVDGAPVMEPGNTGSRWRIHFAFRLLNLRCDAFHITNPETGEDFQRFAVSPGDLVMGDRRYCKRQGVAHVLKAGGHVLARLHNSNFPLFTRGGKPFLLLENLRALKPLDCTDWDVYFPSPGGNGFQKGRLCAIKKTGEAAERTAKILRTNAAKHLAPLLPETLEHARYVCLYTTASRHLLKTRDVLGLYRQSWRLELTCKRLKSIIAVGHIPKHNEESSIAWLYGKMLVAMLDEKMRLEAQFFSPWGYPKECIT